MGCALQVTDMRCRSVFYTALGRLLLINLGEDEDKFDQFMLPLTGNFFLCNCIVITGGNELKNRKNSKISENSLIDI